MHQIKMSLQHPHRILAVSLLMLIWTLLLRIEFERRLKAERARARHFMEIMREPYADEI